MITLKNDNIMNYSFLKFWWREGKFLLIVMLVGITGSIAWYGEQLWFFPGALGIFVNVFYFVGSYFAWKKRFK